MAKENPYKAKVIGKVDLKKSEENADSLIKETVDDTSVNKPISAEQDKDTNSEDIGTDEPSALNSETAIDSSPEGAAIDSSQSEDQSSPDISPSVPSLVSAEESVAPEEKISDPLSPVSPPETDRLPVTISSSGGYLDKYINPSAQQGVRLIGPPEIILSENGLRDLIGEVWCHKVESGLDETGRLVAAQKFGNDPERIFAPAKSSGVIYSQISKLLDGRIDARRLAESTKAAGVDLELKQAGFFFELSHWKRAPIGRLPEKAQRLRLCSDAYNKNLTVEQIKRRVSDEIGKRIPEDTRIGKAIVRQLQAARNLLTDQETKFFVNDKDRLKRALDQDIRSDMLKHTVAARKNVSAINQLLVDLEDALVDIEVSERKKRASEPDGAANADDPGTGQDDQ